MWFEKSPFISNTYYLTIIDNNNNKKILNNLVSGTIQQKYLTVEMISILILTNKATQLSIITSCCKEMEG